MSSGPVFETDDELRRVHGPRAQFSRLGPVLLIHLDSPSPGLRSRREEDYDPRLFFDDGCALCEQARAAGMRVVFDGSQDDW